MTSCALYLRQSIDRTGEAWAIERQREDALRLAALRAWDVVAEYVDNDTSAAGKRIRPGFEALLADLESGRVSVVVAWDLSRLTRNRRDQLRIIELGEKRGVILAFVRGSDLDLSTPAGRLTADILSGVARNEIEVKSDRQRRAALQRSQMGKPPLGVRLSGYTTTGETVETEAVYIRQIFTRFASGDSLYSIAQWLESVKAPRRRATKWSVHSVRTILVNPRYAGRAIYQGETTGVAGNWEAFVDDTTFDFIQAKLADPGRRTQQGTDRKHLGSGLYVCGVCGGRVSGFSGARYRCKQACVNRSRGPVDAYVTAVMHARFERPDWRATIPDDESPTQQLTDALQALRMRRVQVEQDYDAGLIDGRRYRVAMMKVQDEFTKLEAELARLSSNRSYLLLGDNPIAEFESAPLMIKRAMIDGLCEIRLFPAPRGSRTFRAETVQILWRGEETEIERPAEA